MDRLEQYDTFALPTPRIHYDPAFNCRGEFTIQSVSDLAQSIQDVGRLLAPVWVQPAADVTNMPEDCDYRLIAGHRRYRAVTLFLKWVKIPACIFTGLTERQAHVLNFTENLERKDLNPLEEALAIGRLFPNGVTLREAAKELKRDTRWVHARLFILELPPEVQELVAARRVTLLDLELIRKKETAEEKIEVARAIAASKQGQGKQARFVGTKLTRTFRRRRNKSEINGMVAQMLNLGIDGLGPQMGAWCAGHINDEEIQAAIQAELVRPPKPRT